MKKLIFILILFPVIVSASEPLSDYERGVNSALTAIILLDLELSLKGERKTWGEMAEIVRTRLKVRSPIKLHPPDPHPPADSGR